MKNVEFDAGVIDTRPLLDLDEVADRMKFNKRTVQRWIVEKKLRVVRIGRGVRIHEDDLQAFIDAHRI